MLPQSGPPPPPPNEEAATTPIRRPPPPKRQESAPAAAAPPATAKSMGALDNEADGVQLRKNVRNKRKDRIQGVAFYSAKVLQGDYQSRGTRLG